MMKKLVIIIVASLIGFAAHASEKPDDTLAWINDAGVAINKAMSYPMVKRNRPVHGTASFEVTIDRVGNVVNYIANSSSGKIPLYNVAKRALKMAHFPSIPETFSDDYLTFTLEMSYSKKESNSFRRDKTRVTGTRIALLGGTGIVAAK